MRVRHRDMKAEEPSGRGENRKRRRRIHKEMLLWKVSRSFKIDMRETQRGKRKGLIVVEVCWGGTTKLDIWRGAEREKENG